MMPMDENGIVISRERITAIEFATVKSLWEQVYSLRADLERVTRERDELARRLSVLEDDGK